MAAHDRGGDGPCSRRARITCPAGQLSTFTFRIAGSCGYTPFSSVSGSSDNSGDGTLGRIALKQVRVSRQELEARQSSQPNQQRSPKGKANPMNRLVPYLDLFCRLEDEELSRLARVPTSVVSSLRAQVDEIGAALDHYEDLLPRLRDDELVRLTGASAKTVQFWRLCQPRPEPTVKTARKASAADSQTQGEAAPPDPSDSVVGAVDEQLSGHDGKVALEQAQQESGLHDISGEPFPGNETSATPVKAAESDEFEAAFDDITKVGEDGEAELEVTRDDFF